MSRNTHDRQLDHHGKDLDSSVEIDGATTSYGDGDGLHDVLADLDDRVASLEAPWPPQFSSAPHSGVEVEGESYYDTVTHKSRTWDGSAWHDWW